MHTPVTLEALWIVNGHRLTSVSVDPLKQGMVWPGYWNSSWPQLRPEASLLQLHLASPRVGLHVYFTFSKLRGEPRALFMWGKNSTTVPLVSWQLWLLFFILRCSSWVCNRFAAKKWGPKFSTPAPIHVNIAWCGPVIPVFKREIGGPGGSQASRTSELEFEWESLPWSKDGEDNTQWPPCLCAQRPVLQTH